MLAGSSSTFGTLGLQTTGHLKLVSGQFPGLDPEVGGQGHEQVEVFWHDIIILYIIIIIFTKKIMVIEISLFCLVESYLLCYLDFLNQTLLTLILPD